ncbi:MAG TPA: RND transporter, partial [Alcanivorax sp.]|nr:RND transporter [Alcanivorax sp.]
MHKSIVLLTALTWLSGCAVGPDYQPVQPDAPERFLEAPQASAGSADEQRFWAGFDDPMLAGLIRQTLDANRDLRAALARYQRAEALLRGSRAEQLPDVGVSASAAEQHLADVERTPPGAGDDRVELYQAA